MTNTLTQNLGTTSCQVQFHGFVKKFHGVAVVVVVLYSLFVRFLEHRDQIGSTQGVHTIQYGK